MYGKQLSSISKLYKNSISNIYTTEYFDVFCRPPNVNGRPKQGCILGIGKFYTDPRLDQGRERFLQGAGWLSYVRKTRPGQLQRARY